MINLHHPIPALPRALLPLLLLALAGCSAAHRTVPRADGGPGTGPDGSSPGDAGPGVDTGVVPTACGGLGGGTCAADAWCDYPDGSFCGGDDSPGVCLPRPDGCDLVYDPVCGCDGTTYGNACAANAAGMDVASPGECDAPPGDVCTNDAPCTGGGICIGSSCGEAWRCVLSGRDCTDDVAPFCGCDGVTFYDSSTCPLQPFAHTGECGSVIRCDARDVTCRALPPDCPTGRVPSVVGSCWGGCVDIDACSCASADECPQPEIYTCHMGAGRCGPYL